MKPWLKHKLYLGIALMVVCVGTSPLLWHGEDSQGASHHHLKGIHPQRVADFVHDIVEADRTVYSTFIVDRLQKKNILHASENWPNCCKKRGNESRQKEEAFVTGW